MWGWTHMCACAHTRTHTHTGFYISLKILSQANEEFILAKETVFWKPDDLPSLSRALFLFWKRKENRAWRREKGRENKMGKGTGWSLGEHSWCVLRDGLLVLTLSSFRAPRLLTHPCVPPAASTNFNISRTQSHVKAVFFPLSLILSLPSKHTCFHLMKCGLYSPGKVQEIS